MQNLERARHTNKHLTFVSHTCAHTTQTRGTTVYTPTRYRETNEVVTALAGLEDQYRLRPQVKVDEVPAGRVRRASGACGGAPTRGRLCRHAHTLYTACSHRGARGQTRVPEEAVCNPTKEAGAMRWIGRGKNGKQPGGGSTERSPQSIPWPMGACVACGRVGPEAALPCHSHTPRCLVACTTCEP